MSTFSSWLYVDVVPDVSIRLLVTTTGSHSNELLEIILFRYIMETWFSYVYVAGSACTLGY